MKTLRHYLIRIIAVAAGTLAVAAGALTVYVARPWDRDWDAPLPDVRASSDPDVIRRGEYLFTGRPTASSAMPDRAPSTTMPSSAVRRSS